jgi:hypothetical protein
MAWVRARAHRRHDVLSWRQSLLAALPAWLLARALVLAAWAVANARGGAASLHVWDADWYYKLGVDGYGPYGAEGSRFFPLLPGIVGVGDGLGLPARSWLVAVCWVAALFFGAAVHRLTVLETGDEAGGRRAAWLIQLVPGASVLAIGYSEALAGLLAVLYFEVLRHRGGTRVGFLVGALSGLVRPTGVVLSAAGAYEALRSRVAGDRTHAKKAVLALAPLAGTAAFLLWAWVSFGDPLTPYRTQSWGELRGGVVSSPWEWLTKDSPGGYPWQLCLSLLAITAAGLVACARRLPASYLVWSLPMVGLAVTAWGLHSLPRYVSFVFPLWIAVALVCRIRWAWWVVLGASALGFTWVAYLNFVGGPVP